MGKFEADSQAGRRGWGRRVQAWAECCHILYIAAWMQFLCMCFVAMCLVLFWPGAVIGQGVGRIGRGHSLLFAGACIVLCV